MKEITTARFSDIISVRGRIDIDGSVRIMVETDSFELQLSKDEAIHFATTIFSEVKSASIKSLEDEIKPFCSD